jgi:hypothetical protein
MIVLEHAADVHGETFLADVMSQLLCILTDDNLKSRLLRRFRHCITGPDTSIGTDRWNAVGQDDDKLALN